MKRSGTKIFRITNGVETHEGTCVELSEITGLRPCKFGNAVRYKKFKVGDWYVNEIGTYYKYYKVFKDGQLDFLGTVEGIANHYYVTKGYLYGQIKHGIPMLGEYIIQEVEDDK